LHKRPSLYLTVLALAGRDDEIRRRYQRIEALAIERLTALIEFGQRRGLLRAAPDPRAAAFLVHHAIDIAFAQLLRGQADPAPERVLAELTDLLCRYLLEEAP